MTPRLLDGTVERFGVLAKAWTETLRDTIATISTSRAAAKAAVRQRVIRRTSDPAERQELFTALKRDTWTSDPVLPRQRKPWKRGRDRTPNQIVVCSDKYRTFTLAESGNVRLAIPGLQRRHLVRIPLNATVAPSGALLTCNLTTARSKRPPSTKPIHRRESPREWRSVQSGPRRSQQPWHDQRGPPCGRRAKHPNDQH